MSTAQIEARATLLDVTDPSAPPVVVATDLLLQFRVTDTDQGTADSVGFALWSPSGLLVASSAWDGVKVPESLLASGKVQVHFK